MAPVNQGRSSPAWETWCFAVNITKPNYNSLSCVFVQELSEFNKTAGWGSHMGAEAVAASDMLKFILKGKKA